MVIINGEVKFYSPPTYGYGSQYRETAADYLVKEGILPESERMGLVHYCASQGIKLVSIVTDVVKRSDL